MQVPDEPRQYYTQTETTPIDQAFPDVGSHTDDTLAVLGVSGKEFH